MHACTVWGRHPASMLPFPPPYPCRLGKGKLLPQVPPLEGYLQNYANIDTRLRQFEITYVIRRDVTPEMLMTQSPTRMGRSVRHSSRLSRSRFSVLSSRNNSVSASRRESVTASRRDSLAPSRRDSQSESARSSLRESAAASRDESRRPSPRLDAQPALPAAARPPLLSKPEAWAPPPPGSQHPGVPPRGSSRAGAKGLQATAVSEAQA